MKFLEKKPFWKHPIVSGTVAALLSALIISICGVIWNKLDESSFQKAKVILTDLLATRITLPVWVLIPFAASLIVLIIQFLRYIRSRRAITSRNPVLDEKIGSYTFEQLYEILANERQRVRTERMKALSIPPPDESLLTQFINKYEEFRQGVSVGERAILIAEAKVRSDSDGGYTTEVLAPKLLEYGLLYVEKTDHDLKPTGQQFTISTYYISDIGYIFFDCLKKLKTG